MPEIVTDIIVSPARVYHAPVDEPLPADTILAGEDWGGDWEYVGYTKAPLSLLYEYEKYEIEVEQVFSALDRVKQSEALTLETQLAELSLDNLALATGGTVTQTPAGSGQPGKEELEVGGIANLEKRAWGFEGQYVDEDGATFPIRFFVWRGTSAMGGQLTFSKKEYIGIPLKIEALADGTKDPGAQLFKVVKILEPATV